MVAYKSGAFVRSRYYTPSQKMCLEWISRSITQDLQNHDLIERHIPRMCMRVIPSGRRPSCKTVLSKKFPLNYSLTELPFYVIQRFFPLEKLPVPENNFALTIPF